MSPKSTRLRLPNNSSPRFVCTMVNVEYIVQREKEREKHSDKLNEVDISIISFVADTLFSPFTVFTFRFLFKQKNEAKRDFEV